MTSNNNNNNARKKQKRTEGDDSDDYSFSNSLSLSFLAPDVVVPPALSSGNILDKFPDLLSYVLPFIADRTVWNSIASSHKDMHEKSKLILPPWPLCYKIKRGGCLWSWSPCGTRIAYHTLSSNIEIVDQRHGPFRSNGNNNNDIGWIAHGDDFISDLKFSPDGSFLVSIGYDGFIRLWDNVTGNYEQLQEWNIYEEVVEELNINFKITSKVSVSDCNKYIVAALGTCVILKNIENGGKTKSSIVPYAPNEKIYNITTRFSSDGRAVFICSNFVHYDNASIKVWRPYLGEEERWEL